jgi:hypothetical protein
MTLLHTRSKSEDGSITASLPPNPDDILDVTDGIEKSVELEQEILHLKS